LSKKAFGLCTDARSSAFFETTGTLLLADTSDITTSDVLLSSTLVAVNAASRVVSWSVALGERSRCYGIAVLPTQGLVVASDFGNSRLKLHRLSDGTRIASVAVDCPTVVAADPISATVYVNTFTINISQVSAFCWDGTTLVFDGVVEAAGQADWIHPLAVMPLAPGPGPGRGPEQRTSYLVVGTLLSGILRVLSLPDRRLVFTHELKGIKVVGLAADPSGTALAVCDRASKAIHVLPWPLPGMLHE
jgi:hypothetical protein